MVMRIIHPLDANVMYEFLNLLPERYICSIRLKLYNGTTTRFKELEHGSTAYYTNVELQSDSIEAMKRDLEHVDHNQIQKCEVHLQKESDYGVITLSLLELEMSFHDNPTLFPLDKLLKFAREKELHKLTLGFQ